MRLIFAALRIKKLTVTNEAEVRMDSAACLDYNAFPRIGFSSLDSLPKSADTRVDFFFICLIDFADISRVSLEDNG